MSQETVQTVDRALRVLRAFTVDHPELRTSDIVRKVELPRTAVVRILNTLQRAGFIEPVPGEARFRLGLSACELGAAYVASNPLTAVADEILEKLVDRTGYTVYLGVLSGSETSTVRMYGGSRPVHFLWSPGERLPVTTSALGKAMLSHMTPEQVTEIVGEGPLVELTERSLKTRAELDEELMRARERGWAMVEDESYPGLSAVGAAILGRNGTPIAGISIIFLNHPPDPARFEELGELARETADALTQHAVIREAYGAPVFLPLAARRSTASVRGSTRLDGAL